MYLKLLEKEEEKSEPEESENSIQSSETREQVKESIIKFIAKEKEIDYNMIVSMLNIDLELVVKICEELEKDKVIEEMKS